MTALRVSLSYVQQEIAGTFKQREGEIGEYNLIFIE